MRTSCRRTLALAVVIVGVLMAPAAGALATTGPDPYTVVHVTLRDGRIVLNKHVARNVSFVDFLVRNLGKRSHNFRIGGLSTEPLTHGKQTHLYVGFPVAGKYHYASTLHATQKMAGWFHIVSPQIPTGN